MKFKSASYGYVDGKMTLTIEVVDSTGTGAKLVRRVNITKQDAADIFGAILGAFGLKVGR